MRLVNGTNNATGRVEVYYNGAWGTICDDGWDLNDANVVCRMLGFFKASSAPVQAAYGPGSGNILLDEVDCTGEEKNITDCRKNSLGDHDCCHEEDAGVICTGTYLGSISIYHLIFSFMNLTLSFKNYYQIMFRT